MKQILDTNYFIDEYGNVFNSKGHKMKPSISNKGYFMNKLFISSGNRIWIYPHRFVAQYYIPNPDNKPQVNHIDGNPQNNHKNNLEWVTASENQKHRVDVLKKGINGNNRSRLTKEDIIWIRKNTIPNDKNFGYSAIARKYDVWASEIRRIVKNERWKYV